MTNDHGPITYDARPKGKTYEQIAADLDSDLPSSAVSGRQGGGGTTLSYVSSFYVINRLNKALGIGNWAYDSNVTLLHSETAPGKNSVHYSAKVRLVVEFPDGKKTEFADYGYGDGSDKYNIGKAHELAIKEAVTDGLKRCAKNLGMSLGLALYDKTQEYVADDETPKAVAQAPKPATSIAAVKPANMPAILTKIGAASKVVVEKKIKTTQELKDLLKTKYAVERKEDLTPEQAQTLFNELEGLLNAS